MFFKKKKKEVSPINSKFKLDDFVDFYYRDDIYFGKVSNIYLAPNNEVLYDIDIAGQCPATLTGIEEKKVIRIHYWNMKKKINLKPYIIAAIISIIIGAGIFLIFFLTNKTMLGALNGTAYSGIILLSIGGLSFIAKEGFFDFASYGFKQLGSMIFGRTPNAYNDFAGYKDYKMERRKKQSNYYLSFLIVGVLFILAFIILKLI